MKTKVIRIAVTELDENEAYDLVRAIEGYTGDSDKPLPTDKEAKTLALFGAQLSETLG